MVSSAQTVTAPPATGSRVERPAGGRWMWWVFWVCWVLVPVAAVAALWWLCPPDASGGERAPATVLPVPTGLLVPRR